MSDIATPASSSSAARRRHFQSSPRLHRAVEGCLPFNAYCDTNMSLLVQWGWTVFPTPVPQWRPARGTDKSEPIVQLVTPPLAYLHWEPEAHQRCQERNLEWLLMNYCEKYFSLLLVEILLCKGLFLSKTSKHGSNSYYQLSIHSYQKLLRSKEL